MSGAFAGEQTKSLQPELSFVCEDNRGDSSLAASEISRVVSQANNPDVFAIPHLPLQSSKSKKTRSDSEVCLRLKIFSLFRAILIFSMNAYF